MRNNILIGLTGGIGSGKSTVSDYLSSLGENVICADAVSRQVTEPEQAGAKAIRREFGDGMFLADGTLDRQRLADSVFSDKKKLERLNGILHPIIIDNMFLEASKKSGRVFLDAALLIQTGMHKKTDYVWLVTADIKARIERVIQRDGLEYSKIRKRMENQLPDKDMVCFTDEIIQNNGSIPDLYSKVDELLKKSRYQEVIK